jgi:2-hydroxycyclohexanecarboxyl-CoA dehydrogenase
MRSVLMGLGRLPWLRRERPRRCGHPRRCCCGRVGPPDVLVNNAQGRGTAPAVDWAPLEEVSEHDMLDLFRGGVLATRSGMQACFPFMKTRGGTIINLGSRRGVEGVPVATPYEVAKEAIRELSKHEARERGKSASP